MRDREWIVEGQVQGHLQHQVVQLVGVQEEVLQLEGRSGRVEEMGLLPDGILHQVWATGHLRQVGEEGGGDAGDEVGGGVEVAEPGELLLEHAGEGGGDGRAPPAPGEPGEGVPRQPEGGEGGGEGGEVVVVPLGAGVRERWG